MTVVRLSGPPCSQLSFRTDGFSVALLGLVSCEGLLWLSVQHRDSVPRRTSAAMGRVLLWVLMFGQVTCVL